MKKGLVVGKFYPPHKGHHYLIDTALAEADYVYVGVVSSRGQTIPAQLRAQWIKEIHPAADVHVIEDIYADDDSQQWADYALQFLGYKPDIIFTSEQYGTTWAKCLGTEHRLVDLERINYPVSGTKIRSHPLRYWHYLEPPVRAYFTLRICVLGAESSGTTTLSKALASYYKTTWVPEYGRYYTEGKLLAGHFGRTWYSREFDLIADLQNRTEDELALYSNKLIICDTNSFATHIWHERYMKYISESTSVYANNRRYDLHIITPPDIPFEDDGLRDGEHTRHWMHKRFIEELTKRGETYIVVSGKHENRLKKAVERIDRLLMSEPRAAKHQTFAATPPDSRTPQ